MRILLLSNNDAVINVVGICLDKPGFDVFNNSENEVENIDFVIKDVENLDDLSDCDFDKTLFLLPKDLIDKIDAKYKIVKPFLPKDLIDILAQFENSSRGLNKDTVREIHGILKEIDDMDEDISLESMAKELESVDIDIKDIDESTPIYKLALDYEKQILEDDSEDFETDLDEDILRIDDKDDFKIDNQDKDIDKDIDLALDDDVESFKKDLSESIIKHIETLLSKDKLNGLKINININFGEE